MARVLLVDDDTAGLEIRKVVFERHGHRVAAASDAESARVLFHQTAPDTVLMDLRLPELEQGLALIREFRGASPGLRLIVLAGWSADLDGREEAALVDEVIAKPAPSQRLIDAVTRSSSG